VAQRLTTRAANSFRHAAQRTCRWAIAGACGLFAACGPVLLTGDAPTSGHAGSASASLDSGVTSAMPADSGAIVSGGSGGSSGSNTHGGAPRALLTVRPTDCGRCFELVASATGGQPPYVFQWDDQSHSPERRVCTDGNGVIVTVVAEDASSVRSEPTLTRLTAESADVSCPVAPAPVPRLCLMNPSFEGTPAINTGENFDAVPWSACSNGSTSNTPDIGSDTLTAAAPTAIDGSSYVALNQGEQVSQTLCENVQAGEQLSLQLDAMRPEITPGDTTSVFLEIWGGVAADCSQRQLLWASPALKRDWVRYCIKLKSTEFMNQITLRGATDVATLAPEYLIADNLVPTDKCP
jgi:hypothetical protein